MEVKVNRDIRLYQEAIFFGMNLRQLIFALLAVGVAIGIYFGLQGALGSETVSWLCILGAFPFAALGFIKYNGMNAEQFVVAYIKSEFLTPRTLTFQSENLYDALMTAKRNQKPDTKKNEEESENA